MLAADCVDPPSTFVGRVETNERRALIVMTLRKGVN